jgi:hypothetical protein
MHIDTMCNELGNDDGSFDPVSRCTVYGEIASRYIGYAEDILKEIGDAGFTILDSEVIRTSSGGKSQEALLAECTNG